MNNNYVLGFLFNSIPVGRKSDSQKLVLIKKNRPEWQKGLLNGAGGHVEETDKDFLMAMQRECEEETGVKISRSSWRNFATLQSRGWVIHCFSYKGKAANRAKTMTDEEVVLVKLQNLPDYALIPNLKWLIPFV